MTISSKEYKKEQRERNYRMSKLIESIQWPTQRQVSEYQFYNDNNVCVSAIK